MAPKPILKAQITLKSTPAATSTGNVSFMDTGNKRNFGDADMSTLQAGQVLDVERTHNPATEKNGRKYDDSYNIVKWELVNHPDQISLPIAPPKPFLRPRTDPKDQRQMWVTALMKEWMAAYAQSLSITTTGHMQQADAAVVEQAARVCGTVYDRLFGPMTNAPPVEDDMNDEIPDFRQ